MSTTLNALPLSTNVCVQLQWGGKQKDQAAKPFSLSRGKEMGSEAKGKTATMKMALSATRFENAETGSNRQFQQGSVRLTLRSYAILQEIREVISLNFFEWERYMKRLRHLHIFKIEVFLHFLSYCLIRCERYKYLNLFFKNDMSELTKMRKDWEPPQNNVNGTRSLALLKLSNVHVTEKRNCKKSKWRLLPCLDVKRVHCVTSNDPYTLARCIIFYVTYVPT